MGCGIAFSDWSATGAQVEQRRCFAPVPPKGERLEHRILSAVAEWSATMTSTIARTMRVSG
jgi:hypothetical protein